ncbi:MAG: hypothetical protein OEY09_19095 [Gammaproteobacteria bacterium]|nr:hypothetical protein [Gammaproteobacteria bacterium]
MIFIATIPTESHINYGVNVRDLRLFLDKNTLNYGIDDSEAITTYIWEEENNTFIGVVAE